MVRSRSPRLKAASAAFLHVGRKLVGTTGFEPATLWSQTRCATRLRYAPTDRYCNGSKYDFLDKKNFYNHSMITAPPPLTWLAPGEDFPALTRALGKASSAPGLLAAGGALDTSTLCKAYASCIFPWFSEGQPILWWSPDPRMVLRVSDFRLHHSLKKTLKKYQRASRFEVKVDTAFELVIRACSAPRANAHGTWISPEMITAYEGMYQS
eukprot:gene17958-36662_t